MGRDNRGTVATILVVEDEPDVRALLSDHLADAGYLVIQAGDGREVLPAVEAHHPEVILLDVMLPGLDGLDVLDRVRDFDATIGVVMVTAMQDEERARSALRMGAVDYVRKPFELDHVDRAVQSALGWVSQKRR